MSASVRPHRRQPTRLPVPGILQARTLEWVAISFSSAWKWSHSVMSNSSRPHGLQLSRLLLPMGFSRQEYWSGLPLPSPKKDAIYMVQMYCPLTLMDWWISLCNGDLCQVGKIQGGWSQATTSLTWWLGGACHCLCHYGRCFACVFL